jgi:hypothetical protein
MQTTARAIDEEPSIDAVLRVTHRQRTGRRPRDNDQRAAPQPTTDTTAGEDRTVKDGWPLDRCHLLW